jgi:hypothetical protein
MATAAVVAAEAVAAAHAGRPAKRPAFPPQTRTLFPAVAVLCRFPTGAAAVSRFTLWIEEFGSLVGSGSRERGRATRATPCDRHTMSLAVEVQRSLSCLRVIKPAGGPSISKVRQESGRNQKERSKISATTPAQGRARPSKPPETREGSVGHALYEERSVVRASSSEASNAGVVPRVHRSCPPKLPLPKVAGRSKTCPTTAGQ